MQKGPAGKNNGTSDEELMRLSALGDRLAFECLYERYFNKLVWFANGYLKNTEKAQDAVQEVFLKIIEKPAGFDGQRKFSTWFYTVTANHCRNVLRNEENRQRILEENKHLQNQEHFDADEKIDKIYLKEKLRAAIEELNNKEKSLYHLRFEEDLTIREIAGIINIPEGSVKSGIFHLLKKVSKHLKEFTNAG